MIFMEKKVVRSTIYNGACLPGLSLFRVSHTRLRWPLSLSPLVTDPAASRPPAEREDVHRFSVRRRRGSRPDLRHTSFSLTKLRRGRAYATCSLPQYEQIPPAAAHLVTPRRPPGIPSGLAPLPVFPRRCMWIFHSSLPKT